MSVNGSNSTSPAKKAGPLLGNWYEDRIWKSSDDDFGLKQGHTNILQRTDKADFATSKKLEFAPPDIPNAQQKGIRQKLIEQQMLETATALWEEAQRQQQQQHQVEPEAALSSTNKSTYKWPESTKATRPALEHTHIPEDTVPYYKDVPITLYTEKHHTGQFRCTKSGNINPFARDAAFTTPTEAFTKSLHKPE